MLTETFKIK